MGSFYEPPMSCPYKPGPKLIPTLRVILVPHWSAFHVVELSPLHVAWAYAWMPGTPERDTMTGRCSGLAASTVS
jgi:hypothetical protein